MIDIEYLLVLQNFRNGAGAFLEPFFSKLSELLTGHAFYVLIALVLWCIHKKRGQIALMSFSLGSIMFQSLKNTFCVYRPYIRDARVVPFAPYDGYSFPSGHSVYGASLFGSFGIWQWREKRKWLAILLFLCVAIVCFGRNYLGVHTPQDVAVGSIMTILLVFVSEWLLRLADRKSNADWVIVVCGLALTVVFLLYYSTKEYVVEVDADGNSLVNLLKAIETCFASAGAVTGFFIGWLIERRWIHFTEDGSALRRIIRWLVGSMGIWYLFGSFTNMCCMGLTSNWGRFVGNFCTILFMVAVYPLLCMLVRKVVPLCKA